MLLVHILRAGIPLFPPFPAEKIPALLRAKSVLRSDYFWHEGMDQWTSVEERWPPGVEISTEIAPEPAPVRGAFPVANAQPNPPNRRSRTERISMLQYSATRYRETCAPW
jgi:hypothetical protein